MPKYVALFIVFAFLLPGCASSAWKEGFIDNDTLQLVGEGRAREDLSQLQGTPAAREAAIMLAMSHWPKYCGEIDATSFRIENQKKRVVECENRTCRARVVIEKSNLKEKCNG